MPEDYYCLQQKGTITLFAAKADTHAGCSHAVKPEARALRPMREWAMPVSRTSVSSRNRLESEARRVTGLDERRDDKRRRCPAFLGHAH